VKDELDDNVLLDALRAVLDARRCRAPRLPPSCHGRDALEHPVTRSRPRPRLREHGPRFYDHMLQQLVFHAVWTCASRVWGPRNRRTPHGRRHDDHLRRGARRGTRDRRGSLVTARLACRWTRRWLTPWSTSPVGPQPTSRSPRSGHGDPRLSVARQNARITLHVTATGENDHHVAELRSRPSGVRSPKPHSRRLARALDEGVAVSDVVVVDYGAGNTRSVRAHSRTWASAVS